MDTQRDFVLREDISEQMRMRIAVIYDLNRLNGDSELIVMSAAGMAPQRLVRPFVWLSAMVCISIAFPPALMYYLIFLFLRLCSKGVATSLGCYTGNTPPFP